MKRDVLLSAGAAEIRVAIVEDGRLQELFVERLIGDDDGLSRRRRGASGHSLVGNIVLGRVQRVLPGMQAAFVDAGLDRAGFLGAREARCLAGLPGFEDDRAPKISDCVREGDEILVQVVKDPMGEKGARLSANITVPGRLLVLIPNQPGIALSRRIEDEQERARLTALCEEMMSDANAPLLPRAGYIVRSAAIGATLQDLREDAERLAETWAPVARLRQSASVPCTLYHDLDPVQRTMRDEVTADAVRVLIDDAPALEAARAYCRRAMPEALDKLELFGGPGTLFESFGLEDEIAQLTEPLVPLPSGAWITIEGTEALTAIDVNSGRFTEATGLEETSLRVNLEAADEIGRQLRLRGIGGLVVIDFIHLNEPANISRVLEVLTASLAHDRTPAQMSGMSEFGLVEITRKRVRDPLVKLMTETCHTCRGRGRNPTRETVALEILRQVERAAAAAPGRPISVRAAPDVIAWLNAHEGEIRTGLARRGAARVGFAPRSEFERSGFDVATQ